MLYLWGVPDPPQEMMLELEKSLKKDNSEAQQHGVLHELEKARSVYLTIC